MALEHITKLAIWLAFVAQAWRETPEVVENTIREQCIHETKQTGRKGR